jgi:hypothetical protein
MRTIPLGSWFLLGIAGWARADDSGEKVRYLRVTSKETVSECTFALQRMKQGWSIDSVTKRGKTQLSLVTHYDAQDRLTAAMLTLSTGDQKRTCKVEVADGKARVLRDGKPAKELPVPARVIVTSAPDWTDTFLLCRHYDRARGGKQRFAGLWIHPEKEPLRLTFTVEHKGSDTIEHAGKKQRLDRLEIRLRNNDGYTAWADSKGRMTKLQPLGGDYALVRE